jgi:8-oxo-dGTP diphosphatase
MTDRIRVVAGLAVDHNNHVLVAKRPPDKKRPDMYEYPGGKVERAEGDETALAREWMEELKITPSVRRRIARVTFDLESQVVISLFHVVIGAQVPEAVEHTDLLWVDPLYAVERLACVPSLYLFFPTVKAFLRNLAKDAPR